MTSDLFPDLAPAPAPATSAPHQVVLHGADPGPALDVAAFVAVALLRGEAAVLVAAPTTLAAARRALADAGVAVAPAQVAGRYVELDAAETLDALRDADGVLDPARFDAVVAAPLDDLAARFGAVAAYGEMVGRLAAAGDMVGALRLEELWGPVTRGGRVRLLCGYPDDVFGADHGDLHQVQARHDAAAVPVDASWALDLPATAEAAPAARSAVADLSAALGAGGTEWADDAELVVAELVGNAVRHVGSRPTLSVAVHGSEVTFSVTDASDELPVPRGDLLAENGRGYLIIDALSDAWGVERLPRGKRVWARLARP